VTASAAGLTTEAAFSDQSHMGRAVRRATGFSPAHLNRVIATEEAFWCYRLLGERF
jgi:AraC-like DNA-binding protein